MAIFNFRAIGPVFIASVGNYSVNIYNDAYTPIDTADMNQINVLGISRGIYYNLLECDDPTGFADFSEGFSGIHKEIVSGIKLKLGGSDVSSSNPLPVINEQKFSGALQVSGGRMWECPLITKAGVSTKYSAICFFNPTETDLRMMSIALTAWVGSTTQVRLIKTIVDPSTLPATWTEQTGVFANALVKVADSRVCPFKVYTAALDTLDPATWININNTSTTPIGANVRGESKIFEKGTGFILVCVTANITLNSYAIMAEESE